MERERSYSSQKQTGSKGKRKFSVHGSSGDSSHTPLPSSKRPKQSKGYQVKKSKSNENTGKEKVTQSSPMKTQEKQGSVLHSPTTLNFGTPIHQNTPVTPIHHNTPVTPIHHNTPVTPIHHNTPVTPIHHNTPVTPAENRNRYSTATGHQPNLMFIPGEDGIVKVVELAISQTQIQPITWNCRSSFTIHTTSLDQPGIPEIVDHYVHVTPTRNGKVVQVTPNEWWEQAKIIAIASQRKSNRNNPPKKQRQHRVYYSSDTEVPPSP